MGDSGVGDSIFCFKMGSLSQDISEHSENSVGQIFRTIRSSDCAIMGRQGFCTTNLMFHFTEAVKWKWKSYLSKKNEVTKVSGVGGGDEFVSPVKAYIIIGSSRIYYRDFHGE